MFGACGGLIVPVAQESSKLNTSFTGSGDVYKWPSPENLWVFLWVKNWCIYATLDSKKSNWLRPYSGTSFRCRSGLLTNCTQPLVAIIRNELVTLFVVCPNIRIFSGKIGGWGNFKVNMNIFFGCWKCSFIISCDLYNYFELI